MSASGGMQQAQCRTPPSLPPIRQRSVSPVQPDMLWGADGLMSPVRATPSRGISKFLSKFRSNRHYLRGWAHALFVFLVAALIRRSFSGDKSAEHISGGGRKGAVHLPKSFHHSEGGPFARASGWQARSSALMLEVSEWSHAATQSQRGCTASEMLSVTQICIAQGRRICFRYAQATSAVHGTQNQYIKAAC